MQNVWLCERDVGSRAQICIEGRRYGFSAWLVSTEGGRLPIAIGRAKSPKDAMRVAKAKIRRSRDGTRRPRFWARPARAR